MDLPRRLLLHLAAGADARIHHREARAASPPRIMLSKLIRRDSSSLGRSERRALAVRITGRKYEDRKPAGAHATVVALAAIRPKDELEAMIAAQLLAAHNATMECYRRAMIPEQTFDGRSDNLNQANKLSRTYAVLLDALNRHRGKGQQKVVVEHVHVHPGGRAVVGMVGAPGGGGSPKLEEQPHAKQIAYAPKPPMWSADKERELVPVARDAERPVSTARRKVAGRSQREHERVQARPLFGRGD
jgi:hypothetical protein